MMTKTDTNKRRMEKGWQANPYPTYASRGWIRYHHQVSRMSNEGQQDCLEKRKIRELVCRRKRIYTETTNYLLISLSTSLFAPATGSCEWNHNQCLSSMSQPVSAQVLSTMSQHIVFSSNQSVKGLANPLRMVITMVTEKLTLGTHVMIISVRWYPISALLSKQKLD